MKIKFSFLGLLIAALILCSGFRAEAALGTDWHSNTITVTGTGIAPYGSHGAQARIMARRAAQADAYRQLLETVKGVQIDATTTVEMAMTTSDIVNLHVEGVIQGARIISENFTTDGAYEVTMQLPIFGGHGGLAGAVLERPTRVEPFPEVSTTVTVTIRGGYTGLIVDCRGFKVQPVMSPVIKNANGQKIYGHKNLDYDKVIEYGMASYADDMSQATRAGSNPLVIKAVDVEDFNANPVVSMEDANRILSENKSSHFLEDTAVVFLY
ncbi:MAG: LPP20 family lipoprotein [Selenomonadaceae bacterium]|nr:LPP20 family lipoprotein [Selenomonadaceae bacterium]